MTLLGDIVCVCIFIDSYGLVGRLFYIGERTTRTRMPHRNNNAVIHMAIDLSTWMKIGGAFAAGIGSLLLAWRVQQLLKWVVLALVTHERSIEVLLDLPTSQSPLQREAVVGAVRHLLDIEQKLGFGLLVFGLALLGLGMISNAASFLF